MCPLREEKPGSALLDRRSAAPTRDDLLALAQRRFLACESLEMSELAAALGVSRATVYRWAGNKEALLGEVLWRFAEQAVNRARKGARGEGVPYLLQVFESFVVSVDRSEPMRRFLLHDPELALRVLTSQHSVVQPRMVAVLRGMLAEAEAKGTFRPPIDLDSLSYAAVRIGESFLYSDIITGTPRDVQRAVDLLRLILREG
jgi:AcrR family transcriptional regulator